VSPDTEVPEVPGGRTGGLVVVAEVGEPLMLPPDGPVWLDAAARGPHPIPPDDVTPLEQLLLDLAAAERIGTGLPLLIAHAPLMDAARRHTFDMGLRLELFHSDLHEHYRLDCFPRCWVAENVGRCPGGDGLYLGPTEPRCSAAAIHRAWMGSGIHRANVLEPGFRLIGVSAVQGADLRFYATQAFLGWSRAGRVRSGPGPG
jgi:uncharacterized protein YkwD